MTRFLPYLNTALMIFAAVVITMMWRGCGSTKPDQKLIEAKDELIKVEREKTEMYRALSDARLMEIFRLDSLLQIEDKQTIVRYEKIPVYVRSLNGNKDSLRAAGKRAAEGYNLR